MAGQMMMKCVAKRSLFSVFLSLALLCVACGNDVIKSTTTPESLFPTPAPPNQHYPFQEGIEEGLDPADYENKVPTQPAAPGCATKVADPPGIVVRTAGNIQGGLKFDTRPRGKGKNPETNGGNTTLGGFWKESGFLAWYQFKFQVEVTFEGPLQDAFYGQMVTNPVALDSTGRDVEFHDDSPENDSVGREWFLKPGESRSDFPVVEIEGQTVRWIDAPGGTSFRVGNEKMLFIFYAGACGRVTHAKIFKIAYPKGQTPTMSGLTAAQLDAEVRNFKFKR